MEKFRLVVGIDISKAYLSVCIVQSGKLCLETQYPNNAQGLKALYHQLLQLEQDPGRILICCEHTGVYVEKLSLAFGSGGFCLWIVNPLIIKYAQVEIERLKTDRTDARKIAQFAELFQAKAQPYEPIKAVERQIKDLFRLRKQLVKLRQQVLNFASTNLDKALPCSLSKQCFSQMKTYLSQLIKQIEKQLLSLVKSDPQIKRQHQILRSIPGIGPVTAWQLIFTTQSFRKFDSHKQLAAHIGIAPYERSSGSSVRAKNRVSNKAYKPLKTNLTLGAIRHIQPNMFFDNYYQYMREHKNKEHLWIINSIRNMIVKLIFDLIKRDQLFDPQIFRKNKTSWQNHLTLS